MSNIWLYPCSHRSYPSPSFPCLDHCNSSFSFHSCLHCFCQGTAGTHEWLLNPMSVSMIQIQLVTCITFLCSNSALWSMHDRLLPYKLSVCGRFLQQIYHLGCISVILVPLCFHCPISYSDLVTKSGETIHYHVMFWYFSTRKQESKKTITTIVFSRFFWF
jgi:hypothetical protein